MSADRPWPTGDWHPGCGEPRAIPHARIPAGGYARPNLHLTWWFFLPSEVKAAALWSVAWTATTVLTGIRVWRLITEHDDETGD